MTDGVCVLGAGPAGATAAARLAGCGHDVVLVEARTYPRPQVGESLGPGIRPLLAAVGVDDGILDGILDGADGEPAPMSLVRWAGPDDRRIGPDAHRTVDRAVFDTLLLRRALDAGVRLIAPARAGRPRRTVDGWEVPLPGGRIVQAGVVVDATGRRRALGGIRTLAAARTTALHALWVTPAAATPRWSVLDVGPSHWSWAGRRPDGTTRVVVVVDPAAVATHAGGAAGLYRELVAFSEPITALVDGARTGPVRVCDASSYQVLPGVGVEEPDGPLALTVGEAAFGLDPLSACGVQEAVRSGIVAATAVHTALRRPADRAVALRFHRDLRAHTVARHARTAAGLYAEHRAWADRPFWTSRSPGADVRIPRPAHPPAGDVAGQRLRLARDARVVDTPVLVGEFVELRPAVVHPDLDRPVAYLGGTGVETVIDRACAGHAGPEAGWMVEHGLLEPTGPDR